MTCPNFTASAVFAFVFPHPRGEEKILLVILIITSAALDSRVALDYVDMSHRS